MVLFVRNDEIWSDYILLFTSIGFEREVRQREPLDNGPVTKIEV